MTADDVRREAAEIVKQTRDFLEAQQQLGVDFVPGAPEVAKQDRPQSERELLLSGTLSLVETRQVLVATMSPGSTSETRSRWLACIR
ncbi:MAG: hypothetical protein V3R47_06665 [candidate division NC10 bacterium]